MKRVEKYWVAFTAITMALLMSGCSVLNAVEEHPLSAWIVVEQATMRVLDGDVDRAKKTQEIVKEVRQGIDSDQSVTLRAVEKEIRMRINWDSMALADQRLIDKVITVVREDLERRYTDTVLDAEDKVKLSQVLFWIEDAAKLVVEGSG